MLSAADTVQRRDRAGRRTSTLLQQRPQYDSNNNAKNNKPSEIMSAKDLPNAQSKKKAKAEKKASRSRSRSKSKEKGRKGSKSKEKGRKGSKSSSNVDQKDQKKKGKIFASLPSFKPKFFTSKVQVSNDKQWVAVPVETYTEKIAEEEVTVNKVVLFIEDEEKNIYINSEASRTPPSFLKTLLYYQQINKARITYIRAADYAGDLLLRGDVEGDAESWEKFLEKKKEEVRKWRKDCDERHDRRAKESRQVVEGEGSLCFTLRKIGRDVKAWMWDQFVDIFPCCVPE